MYIVHHPSDFSSVSLKRPPIHWTMDVFGFVNLNFIPCLSIIQQPFYLQVVFLHFSIKTRPQTKKGIQEKKTKYSGRR